MRKGYSRSLSSGRRSERHSKDETRVLQGALIVLLIVLSCLVTVESGVAQSDSDRRLYENDELFNQLSGAYRTKLERMFGKKLTAEQSDVVPSDARTKNEKRDEPSSERSAIQPGNSADDLHGGLFASPTAVDALTNNNTGASGTANFTQSETDVLAFGSRVVVAFNDAGSNSGGTSKFTGYAYSSDGGFTFTDGGTLPTNAGGDAGDPVLARNGTTGRIYLATLGYNVGTIQVFRSDDNGVTWMAPVNGTPGGASEDKEWITVDNFAGSGNGNVYLISRSFGAGNGIYMYRSVDNGATFGPSSGVLIIAGNQGAFVVVGSDHAVYAFWYAGTTLQVRKSTDQGLTFGAAVTVASGLVGATNGDLGLTGIRNGLSTAAAFRSSEFPHVAVNPVDGSIYVAYNNDGAGADKGDIYLVQSTNGGATWGAPIKVNDDLTTTDQWQPTVAVLPDGSRIGVFYYSRQEDPSGNNLFKYYGRIGAFSCGTVAFTDPSFAISDVGSLPEFGRDAVVNSTYMGDYNHVVATSGKFHVVWSDNRDDLTGGAPRKDPNVYFENIPVVSVSAPALAYVAHAMSGGNGNGLVDPNECNEVTVTIRNAGTATATGIVGTLSTSTPGVTVTVASSSYVDLAPCSAATNTLNFEVSTAPSYVCGTPVALTLTLTYSGGGSGSNVMNFSLPSAAGGYTVTSASGATIVSGTTDIGNHGDDVVTTIALPFTYTFYGVNFTAVNASSNGNLQFTSSSNAYSNVCLPTSNLNNAILPHWDDQRTDGTGGGIFTSTSGIAPNRIFNIEWRTVYFGTTTTLNYEVRLYEGQAKFDVIYGTLNGTGSSATVGVQQAVGTAYTQNSCNTASLSAGQILTFQLAGCLNGGGGCIPLPVQLASFTGSVVNGNQVKLDWMTLSEINNYGFEVQKSVMQPESFVTIPGSFIPGHGTTNEPHHYSFIDYRVEVRTVYYRLRQIDLDGSVHYTEPIRIDVVTDVEATVVPVEFSLAQNFPNPFNPSTVIRYALPVASAVRLEVFNTLGQQVAVLVDERQEAGFHSAVFQNSTLSSGVYLYTIKAGQFKASKKLLLLR